MSGSLTDHHHHSRSVAAAVAGEGDTDIQCITSQQPYKCTSFVRWNSFCSSPHCAANLDCWCLVVYKCLWFGGCLFCAANHGALDGDRDGKGDSQSWWDWICDFESSWIILFLLLPSPRLIDRSVRVMRRRLQCSRHSYTWITRQVTRMHSNQWPPLRKHGEQIWMCIYLYTTNLGN